MVEVFWTELDTDGERKNKGVCETAAGRALLAYGMKKLYRLEKLPDIQKTEEGKPFFGECPEIGFNITHCRGTVACVIAECAVGIDAERIRICREGLLRKTLSSREYQTLQGLAEDEKKVQFLRYWTLKEAYVKAKGCGLRVPPDTIEFTWSASGEPVCVDASYTCVQRWVDDSCVISVCWKDSLPPKAVAFTHVPSTEWHDQSGKE